MADQELSRIVGLDVGGANLKYARGDGLSIDRIFALWREPENLAAALTEDLTRLSQLAPVESLAVTMTGELADCFSDRHAGVSFIVDQVSRSAAECGIQRVAYYGLDGRFRDRQEVIDDADLVAAGNWHALASFVAARWKGPAILADVGSTTTDLVPVVSGRVATDAKSDLDRLTEGSLVYVGCRRTAVCAIVDRLHFRGDRRRIMNEVFATIDDVRLLLGKVAGGSARLRFLRRKAADASLGGESDGANDRARPPQRH